MDKHETQHCLLCNEKWFDVKVSRTGNLWQNRRGRDTQLDDVNLHSPDNRLELRAAPPDLLALLQIEGMMVAKIHVTLEVCRPRGAHWHYKGHICGSMRDMAKV